MGNLSAWAVCAGTGLCGGGARFGIPIYLGNPGAPSVWKMAEDGNESRLRQGPPYSGTSGSKSMGPSDMAAKGFLGALASLIAPTVSTLLQPPPTASSNALVASPPLISKEAPEVDNLRLPAPCYDYVIDSNLNR